MTSRFFLAAVLGFTVFGCAGRRGDVIAPDAALGRVIIYRNGVAYFERRALTQRDLTLRVPRDRVDDFLKSLTVTDAESGEPLSISYPTARQIDGRWVQMTVQLPKGKRDVRISYVTESPAWKPSYRVFLDPGGKGARLQSLAIVDNVSGEAWDRVTVGVGSTSALSFRYDLHSVQTVQRETIDSGTRVAGAPPKGGSPYAVAGEKRRVLANLSSSVTVESSATASHDSAGISLAGTSAGESTYTVEGSNVGKPRKKRRSTRRAGAVGQGQAAVVRRSVKMEDFRNIPASKSNRDFAAVAESSASAATAKKMSDADSLNHLATELAANQLRVRLEGYAIAGESDAKQQALRRANNVREQLVRKGIAADRIEVVASDHVATSPQNAVQVVAIEAEPLPTERRDVGDDDGPRGTAHFMSDKPISIEAGHSAMVTLFDAPTQASRVYLYDPVSARGSKRFAFNAVRIVNPSKNTLDSGPITVYAGKQFLGEGLTEPIPAHSAAMVPYALDRTVIVDPKIDTREEIERLLKVERGIATAETRRVRRTVLEVANRGTKSVRMYVRHRVATGWSLHNPPRDVERLGRDVLIPVTVSAGKTATLELEERLPITKSLDLRSRRGLDAVEVYLRADHVTAPLRAKLEPVLAAYRKMRTADEKLTSRRDQMGVLRSRVDQLNVQLVTLRKVKRAQKLSGHLARKMRELGDRMDKATIEVTQLETDRLTAAIEFQNLVADLALDTSADEGATSAVSSP